MVEKVYVKTGNIQEINEMAEKLRRIRLLDEVKELAGKYFVPEQDLSEFLSGKRRFLIDGGDTSKEYETARSKVLDEMFELKDPQFADVIGNYLLKCCEDSRFADLVLQKHKTLQRCIESLMGKVYDMVSDEVKENSKYAGKAVAGEAVFDWVAAYYAEDDREEAAKRAKEAEEDFQKRLEQRKKAVLPKSKTGKTTKKSGTPKKLKQGVADGAAPDKNEKSSSSKTKSTGQEKGQVEGQVSLFESGLAG